MADKEVLLTPSEPSTEVPDLSPDFSPPQTEKIRQPLGKIHLGRLPLITTLLIYLLAMGLTATNRHGAERHYLLTRSMLERQTFNLTWLRQEGNYFATYGFDLVVVNGEVFSDHYPGQALLGLPGYAAFRWLATLDGFKLDDKLDFQLGLLAMNLTTSALFSALAGYFLCYLLFSAFPPTRKRQIWLICGFSLFFFLATPLFYYSTHVQQNATDAALVFMAIGACGLSLVQTSSRRRTGWLLLGGFCAGLGGAVNLSAVVSLPACILILYTTGFTRIPRSKTAWLTQTRWGVVFGLAALPGLGWLFYYQYVAFGSPFTLASAIFEQHETHQPIPIDVDHVLYYLDAIFTSYRTGLFTYTPLLAFSLGLAGMWGIISLAQKSAKSKNPAEVEAAAISAQPEIQLRQILWRSFLGALPILLLQPFAQYYKIYFEWGVPFEVYVVYSARYLLALVWPLGYILFAGLYQTRQLGLALKLGIGLTFGLIALLSLSANISATLIGDFIFSTYQVHRFTLDILAGQVNPFRYRRPLVDY